MTDSTFPKLETLSLTQIIRLQNDLSKILAQRFERRAALLFSDIVESTAYFARFGDEAGHRLQQQHFDLLSNAIEGTAGLIVDTAGDGILLSFPSVGEAIESLLRFKRLMADVNSHLSTEHRWTTRTAAHYGTVLSEGAVIAGDSVNICTKIAESAVAGSIRLSRAAFNELPNSIRLVCQTLGEVALGTYATIEVMELNWQELLKIPSIILLEETGISFPLPAQPIITFGRLASINGSRANDIILELPNPDLTNQISRWHFEIIREPDALVLRSLSDKRTEVDGKPLARGDRTALTIGSKVRISGVLTLAFLSQKGPMSLTDTTTTHPSPSSIRTKVDTR